MKKIITILTTMTLTSSITPLTIACSKKINHKKEHNDATKLDNAVIMLQKINKKQIELTNLSVAQLKNAIKNEIILKGDLTLEKPDGTILKTIADNDIITVKGIVKSKTIEKPFKFTVKVKEEIEEKFEENEHENEKHKEKGFNISAITADMILNFKNKYTGQDEKGQTITVTPDKLGNLNEKSIELIIKNNLKGIFASKLTKVDNAKLLAAVNYEYLSFNYYELGKWSDAEIISWQNFRYLIDPRNNIINIKVENINKKITVTLQIIEWNNLISHSQFINSLKSNQKEAQDFLNLSYDEQKNELISQSGGTNPQEEQIKLEVNALIRLNKASLKVSLESLKSMYDLIKGKNAILKINLTNK